MHFAKPQWLNSLSIKILLAYLVGVLLSIMLVVMFAYWIMVSRSHYFAGIDILQLTQERAQAIEFDAKDNPIGFKSSEDELSWIFDSLKQETAYRLLNASGQTVLSSAAGEAFWHGSQVGKPNLAPGSFEFDYQGALIHGATALISHRGQTWYLQFAVSGRLHYLLHRGFALPFMGIGILVFSVVLLVVFGISGFITMRYTLKPLRVVSESAAAISPSSIHTRLQLKDVPSEITPLVESFNRALDKLEQGYRAQQEFLATTAHELKTPLSLIRAQIEMKSASEHRDALLNDVEHMTRQVQQLLLLAEVSEEQNYKLIDTDIAEVVQDVARFLKPMAEKAQVTISVFTRSQSVWRADHAALFTLIKNLLENAIQHAPVGSEVHALIDKEIIIVRDWGPGIETSELPRIFTRFWRGAHRRDHGAGLGLTICREIALAHRWTLAAHNTEPGLSFHLSNSNANFELNQLRTLRADSNNAH